MVRWSKTSTSSAQVDGQSCGQAEAAMRGRTVWFIAFVPYRVFFRLGEHRLRWRPQAKRPDRSKGRVAHAHQGAGGLQASGLERDRTSGLGVALALGAP